MQLNPFGEIVYDEWTRTSLLRQNIELGAYCVMPNHFHAIVTINDRPVGAYCNTPLPMINHLRSPSQTIGAIIRGFKGATTKRINELTATFGLPVWQRNYFEHIITSDDEYATIDAYISSNPANWLSDAEFCE